LYALFEDFRVVDSHSEIVEAVTYYVNSDARRQIVRLKKKYRSRT